MSFCVLKRRIKRRFAELSALPQLLKKAGQQGGGFSFTDAAEYLWAVVEGQGKEVGHAAAAASFPVWRGKH